MDEIKLYYACFVSGGFVLHAVPVKKCYPYNYDDRSYVTLADSPWFGDAGERYYETEEISTDKSKTIQAFQVKQRKQINYAMTQLGTYLKALKDSEAE